MNGFVSCCAAEPRCEGHAQLSGEPWTAAGLGVRWLAGNSADTAFVCLRPCRIQSGVWPSPLTHRSPRRFAQWAAHSPHPAQSLIEFIGLMLRAARVLVLLTSAVTVF